MRHRRLHGGPREQKGKRSGARPQNLRVSTEFHSVPLGWLPYVEQLGMRQAIERLKWSRLFGQIFRFDEWIVCRG